MATKKHSSSVSSHSTGTVRNIDDIQISPLWMIGIFMVLTGIFFFPILMGNAFLWEDFIEQTYPIQSFASKHLAQGQLPFWNPYSFNGMPFLADVQVGFFYPPNMILAFFVKNGAVSVYALQCLILAHVVVAQTGMALLLRSWDIRSASAIVGGVIYGFSGMIVCHIFHPMMVYHCAWLPFILLHFFRGLQSTRAIHAWKHTLFAGMLFGMTMLAGHPQSTLYIALLLGFATVYHCIEAWKEATDRRSMITVLTHITLRGVAVIGIAGALFAIQLLPSQELATLSERNTLSYEKATDGSLTAGQLLTSVVPRLFGSSLSTQSNPAPWYLHETPYYYYWETSFYAGSSAMVLVCVAFFARMRHKHRSLMWWCVAIMVFGSLYALGKHGFLFEWMFALPYFNQFRIPARMMLFVSCAVPILSALALHTLMAKESASLSLQYLLGAGSVPLVVAGAVASGVIPSLYDAPPSVVQTIQGYGVSALLFGSAMLAVIVLLVKRIFPSSVLVLCAGVLVFVQLYVEGSGFNRGERNPAQAYSLPVPLVRALSIVPPDTLFRVKTRDRGIASVQRNQGMMTPIMMFEGYNQLLLQRRMPPLANADATHDMLSIRYEIKNDPQAGAYFAERTTALPFARMVYHVGVESLPKITEQMKDASFDYRHRAMVEESLPFTLPATLLPSTSAGVHCTRYENNHQEYDVTTEQNGLLVLGDIWYPAFDVLLDGAPVPLYRVNTCFRGVAIPAGKHHVTLQFRSPAFERGAMITMAMLGMISIALVILHARDTQSADTKQTLS